VRTASLVRRAGTREERVGVEFRQSTRSQIFSKFQFRASSTRVLVIAQSAVGGGFREKNKKTALPKAMDRRVSKRVRKRFRLISNVLSRLSSYRF
jgi:hypothetical protein